jgi:hypothetical protein
MLRDIRGRAGDGLYGRLQRRLAVVPAYDLPLTPALAVPPFEHGIQGPGEIGGRIVEPFYRLSPTFPFNLTGQPAATVTAPMWLFERQLLYCGGHPSAPWPVTAWGVGEKSSGPLIFRPLMERPVDPITQGVGGLVGEGLLQIPEDDAHQEVLVPWPRPEAADR